MNHLDQRLYLRLPRDPELPGLAALFDGGRVAAMLAGIFPGEEISGCYPLYVRYKPETNAVVAWKVELAGRAEKLIVHGKAYTREHFSTAKEKVETSRWLDTALGEPYCAVPEEALLLFNFPNDPTLPGLRLATERKKLQRALYAHVTSHPETEWRISDRRMVVTPIRFKPEKRAVLQVDTKAVHRTEGRKEYFRVYARISTNPRAEQVAQLMNRLHAQLAGHEFLSTPAAMAYLPEVNVTLVPDAGGQLMPLDRKAAAVAGKALAAFHGLKEDDIEPRDFNSVVTASLDNATTLCNLLPELAGEIKELADDFAARAKRYSEQTVGKGLVHGDFHPEQLLADGPRIILMDFDRSYLGDQLADLGNFQAHLIYRDQIEDLSEAGDLMNVFLDEYVAGGGSRPEPKALAFWTATGLFNLAPGPFRGLDPAWPHKTNQLLAMCRRELSCA